MVCEWLTTRLYSYTSNSRTLDLIRFNNTLFFINIFNCVCNLLGLPSQVLVSGGSGLKGADGWKDLLGSNSESFYYDKGQEVLWVQLIGHTNATIVMQN